MEEGRDEQHGFAPDPAEAAVEDWRGRDAAAARHPHRQRGPPGL